MMFSSTRRRSALRPARIVMLRPLLIFASLMFGACDGAENPLAPGDDLGAPSSEPTAGETLAPGRNGRPRWAAAREQAGLS